MSKAKLGILLAAVLVAGFSIREYRIRSRQKELDAKAALPENQVSIALDRAERHVISSDLQSAKAEYWKAFALAEEIEDPSKRLRTRLGIVREQAKLAEIQKDSEGAISAWRKGFELSLENNSTEESRRQELLDFALKLSKALDDPAEQAKVLHQASDWFEKSIAAVPPSLHTNRFWRRVQFQLALSEWKTNHRDQLWAIVDGWLERGALSDLLEDANEERDLLIALYDAIAPDLTVEDGPKGRKIFDRLLRTARAIEGGENRLADALSRWSDFLRLLGERETSEENEKEAIALWKSHGTPRDLVWGIDHRASRLFDEGQFEAANKDYEDAWAAAQSLSPQMRITLLSRLSRCQEKLGHPKEALDYAKNAYQEAQTLGQESSNEIAMAGWVYARILGKSKEDREAARAILQREIDRLETRDEGQSKRILAGLKKLKESWGN